MINTENNILSSLYSGPLAKFYDEYHSKGYAQQTSDVLLGSLMQFDSPGALV